MALFQQKRAWAKENPLFWANVFLGLLSVTLIFCWSGTSDLPLRAWGMALQLIGLITVWLDLTSTARHFGKGRFFANTLAWFKTFGGRNNVLMAAPGTLTLRGGSPSFRQRRPANPNAPLADRIAALEHNVTQIDGEITAVNQAIGDHARDTEAKFKVESDEREKAIDEVKRNLEDVATTNVATLAFGAFWLGIGVVIATLAPELVKMHAGKWCEIWQALN